MLRAVSLLFGFFAAAAAAGVLWNGAGWLLSEPAEATIDRARGRLAVKRGHLSLRLKLKLRETGAEAQIDTPSGAPGELLDLADDYARGRTLPVLRDPLAPGVLRLTAEERATRRGATAGCFAAFVMMGFAALGAHIARKMDLGFGAGVTPAPIFSFIGFCLLAAALAVFAYEAHRLSTWVAVPAEEVRHTGDALLAMVPDWIELEPEARELIAGQESEGTLYTFADRTYETGPGLCPGDGCRVFVNPRWPREIAPNLAWNGETMIAPLILSGLGLAFAGAGWATRKLGV